MWGVGCDVSRRCSLGVMVKVAGGVQDWRWESDVNVINVSLNSSWCIPATFVLRSEMLLIHRR